MCFLDLLDFFDDFDFLDFLLFLSLLLPASGSPSKGSTIFRFFRDSGVFLVVFLRGICGILGADLQFPVLPKSSPTVPYPT